MWNRMDSNHRRPLYKSGALPLSYGSIYFYKTTALTTELRVQIHYKVGTLTAELLVLYTRIIPNFEV